MPLHMRMPKRGFNNIFANDFSEVNIGRLQKAIDEKRLDISAKVTEEILRKDLGLDDAAIAALRAEKVI